MAAADDFTISDQDRVQSEGPTTSMPSAARLPHSNVFPTAQPGPPNDVIYIESMWQFSPLFGDIGEGAQRLSVCV